MIWMTIQHRPYVVVFLITFLLLATLHIGIFRTIAWLVWGYAIAFLSEVSSIHNGFPYGLYHYIPSGFTGELQLAGVPVWDSASYVFIAYAAYALSWFLIEPHFGRFKIDPHVSPSKPFKITLVASFLMMMADVVIDPTSNLGEKWFLGKVYFYPNGGSYFGVPLSNFVGWFLVAFVILTGFQLFEKFIFVRMKLPVLGAKRFSFQALLGPLFYFGIVGFMLAIQVWIGAYILFAVSTGIALLIFIFVTRRAVHEQSSSIE